MAASSLAMLELALRRNFNVHWEIKENIQSDSSKIAELSIINKARILQLKNFFTKSFLTEATTSESRDVLKYLSLQPASGELPSMYDRSSQNQTIQVSMNAKKEISIRDEPILKCQVIDPSVSESNGVIANIPIKVSVKVWLSKLVHLKFKKTIITILT